MPRLTSPFGFATTALDIVRGLDLAGKRILVTGGATGIGLETTRALASAGAELTIATRDSSNADRVAEAIGLETGSRVLVEQLDLAEGDSIAALADRWKGPLHVLINNAGVMALPEQRTVEGWEMQFAVNYLGHFALALGLHHALKAAGGARIVSVSSSAHQASDIVYEDIHFRRRPYDPIQAYGQSKTANALFAVEADRRWQADGIRVNSLMPGAIPTNLQRHIGGMRTPVELRKSPAQGAATSVLVAVSPLLDRIGGRYFADCNEALPLDQAERSIVGVAAYALDPGNAARLWEVSEEMVRGDR